jgi:hypothetical protein
VIGVAHDEPGDDEEAIDLARRQLAECLTIAVPRPLDEISAHVAAAVLVPIDLDPALPYDRGRTEFGSISNSNDEIAGGWNGIWID